MLVWTSGVSEYQFAMSPNKDHLLFELADTNVH
jgi:hypothetical protein